MKTYLAIFNMLLFAVSFFFLVGCEGGDDPPDNSYSSTSYEYSGYANVFVDNQGPVRVRIIVGNAPTTILDPGEGKYESKYLVNNQALWLSIEFISDDGYIFDRSDRYGFYATDHQQNLVINGPGDVRSYK